jgi:hypothetical protein
MAYHCTYYRGVFDLRAAALGSRSKFGSHSDQVSHVLTFALRIPDDYKMTLRLLPVSVVPHTMAEPTRRCICCGNELGSRQIYRHLALLQHRLEHELAGIEVDLGNGNRADGGGDGDGVGVGIGTGSDGGVAGDGVGGDGAGGK